MALSAQAINSLKSGQYGGSYNPYASSAYSLGAASAGYDVKKYQEQLALEEKKYQEQLALEEKKLDQMIEQWKGSNALNLLSQGYGTAEQQKEVINNLTGLDLAAPSTSTANPYAKTIQNQRTINLGSGYGTMVDARPTTGTGDPYTGPTVKLGNYVSADILRNQAQKRKVNPYLTGYQRRA